MGDASELDLNSHHENGLEAYLKFCRRQRGECLRSVNACFHDAKTTRLTDDTYTKEEIEDMIENLANVVGNEVETELLHSCHSESVLISSLFSQAQKWHLDLNVDIAQLENQEKLASIRQFESIGPQKCSSPLKKLPQLTPGRGEGEGPVELLETHIEKLDAEKKELLNRLKELESKVISLTLEKENMQIDKSASEKEVNYLKRTLSNKSKDEEFTQIADEMKDMKDQFAAKEEENKEEAEKLKHNLLATEKSLKQIQAQLMLAEKELEKNFSQTGAYQNMKKMLAKKNSQLHKLRIRLAKYEPLEDEDPVPQDD